MPSLKRTNDVTELDGLSNAAGQKPGRNPPARRARAATGLWFGFVVAIAGLSLAGATSGAAAPEFCTNAQALGVTRIAQIDASAGGLYGSITKQPALELLGDKEVVLTFDDGPYPGLTRQILDTLDKHCTRATFFVVGQMVQSHPDILREEIARGHTIGTHTQTHPLNMRRLRLDVAKADIEKGFASTAAVAGDALAPFFRFPGLGDSPATLAYLKSRGIATFSVDVVTNDSFIRDPRALAKHTLNILDKKGRGILLFHDIKASTAKALPFILDELQKRGYKVVHLKPKAPYKANEARRSPAAGGTAAGAASSQGTGAGGAAPATGQAAGTLPVPGTSGVPAPQPAKRPPFTGTTPPDAFDPARGAGAPPNLGPWNWSALVAQAGGGAAAATASSPAAGNAALGGAAWTTPAWSHPSHLGAHDPARPAMNNADDPLIGSSPAPATKPALRASVTPFVLIDQRGAAAGQ